MSASTIKWGYFITTGLFTAMIASSVFAFYIAQTEVAQEAFQNLGFPAWLVLPLAGAKLLGLLALWIRKVPQLTTMAYAGFFFNLILAIIAHVSVGDGEFGGALGALVLVLASFFLSQKHFANSEA